MSYELGKKDFSLRPRARIVRTFGEELISNDHVAIVELVKNSYDADAHNVEIKFEPPLSEGEGSVTITDDGVGMSPEDVETFWMEPASISKFSQRKSKNGRAYLGQKGIGRFSTAKLAARLTLTTRKDDFPEVEAVFNWDDYYDPTKYLDEVSGSWEVKEPSLIQRRGTILRMEGLHSSWDDKKIEELVIQLQRLISPVAPLKDFKITLILPEKFKMFAGEIKPPKTLSNPDYTIKAELKNDGSLKMIYTSGNLPGTEEEIIFERTIVKTGKIPTCGPAEFEFRVWDLDRLGELAEELKKSVKYVRDDLKALSGISVYRDNFRVSPYGNPGNDWLRLDLRRVQTPTLRVSNNQVAGRISITDTNNPVLADQTNREGIVDSQALKDLQDVAKLILTELESRRYRERREPVFAETRDPLFMQQKIDLGLVREAIRKKLPDDKEVEAALDKEEAEINRRVDELRDVVVRYRRLSTLGQLMDVVLHDAGNSLSRVTKGIQIVEEEVGNLSDKVTRNVQHIKQGSKLLTELFKRLEPFGGRRRERVKTIEVEGSIEDVFKIYEQELSDMEIDYTVAKSRSHLKISESDFKLIFVNLLNNSLYWLGRLDKDTQRRINVSVASSDGSVDILFEDNGPGISPDDAPYVFDPYYSKKPDGTGLGLTIVGEIVTEYGGKLELVEDGEGATFRISLPAESD